MFGRTVWSDDVLAETITDIIHYFSLSSLKTLGTAEAKNHIDLSEMIRKVQEMLEEQGGQFEPFKLCDSATE